MTGKLLRRARGSGAFLSWLVILALLTAPAAAQAVGAFVTGAGDLPLMAGLVENPEAGLVFDKPEGRIVEAWAWGAVERSAVEAFYAETLPALGWTRGSALEFTREDEALRITITEEDGAVTVRFSLSPK